jgi:hypothetical protein
MGKSYRDPPQSVGARATCANWEAPPYQDGGNPVAVPGLETGVTAISAGEAHTCALVQDQVICWGQNTYGQVGSGTKSATSGPVKVRGLPPGVQAIAAGSGHTCALVDGKPWCWGNIWYFLPTAPEGKDGLSPVEIPNF